MLECCYYGWLKTKCIKYWLQSRKVYLTMSANASDSDFSLYGMLYLAHRAFTCGWILYKLWRGIVGNKLQTSDTKEHNMHSYRSVSSNYLSTSLNNYKKINTSTNKNATMFQSCTVDVSEKNLHFSYLHTVGTCGATVVTSTLQHQINWKVPQ